MPTKRRRYDRTPLTLGTSEQEHLLMGLLGDEHMLDPACWICGHETEPHVRAAWERARDEVLREWARFDHPFPCWAQVVFDGVAWPPASPTWSDYHRRWHGWVEGALPRPPDAA